jgi:hypothetical protein
MKRFADWEERLAAYIEPLRRRPFAWGTHDCCTFTLSAVEAMTGQDPMPEFRGRYRSLSGSIRALRKIGAGDLVATLTQKLGEPIVPSLAQRGDVVMAGGSIGICFGPFALMVGQEAEREGLIRIPQPFDSWEWAWRV